ncbi:hypothetical protein COCON_G00135210 [Conger conger]|uniref:Zinc finger protein ZFPM2 n=1 Tax=Conger conger TaxID=82655 RepID=A0A9Q1DEK6_CONCO|nr:hypothetical protein COCON_G00135210 [Conger conger]
MFNVTWLLENGQEEENEECVSEENDLTANKGFTVEENCSTDYEPENSKDLESSCHKGEDVASHVGDGTGVGQKYRRPPIDPEAWDGPRELEVIQRDRERRIHSRQQLSVGMTWGPFEGKIAVNRGESVGLRTQREVPLALTEGSRWLLDLTWLGAEDNKNNCVVYSKGGQLWCTVTKHIAEGEELVAFVVDFNLRPQAFNHMSALTEGMYPARLLDSIPLLPQQAAMASILPTAIVNKDIFPCKACGIWYRSERNLQAHLMYYCSGRQANPETLVDKSESGPHQMPTVCPFPQCNKSCSGPRAMETHLATHSSVKMEETLPPGTRLKCTICTYTADSLIAFQHHILSHLSQTAFRCNRCHISFQSHMELVQHQDLHRHGGGLLHREGDGKLSPRLGEEGLQQMRVELARCRDVLQAPKIMPNEEVCSTAKLERAEKMAKFSAQKEDGNLGSKASFLYPRVKSEPSSPRPASSPVQASVGPAFPMGPLLSQFPFPQDISMVPQASEILAKMSELVHRRLQHGANAYPPLMYSPLVPKGATCFECNITFNNLENYFVHKKHYCNSRWQDMAKSPSYPSGLDKVAETVSPNSRHSSLGLLNGPLLSEVDSRLLQPAGSNSSVSHLINGSVKVPDKELSGQVKKSSTPPGAEEKPNGTPANSNSPSTPLAEGENDSSKTNCEACKITFSREENYIVHKQYYCASRHDPPVKRTAVNKMAMQRTMRTRKRKKLYELCLPDQEVKLSQMRSPGFLMVPTFGSPCTSQESVDSPENHFHQQCNMFPGMVPKHLEASLAVTKSALVSKCNAIEQQEADAPMDLSKKCSPHSDKTCNSPKRLMDYHECMVCKIGFNKVEDYLTHKQNFCPVTAQQPEIGSLDQAVFPAVKFERHNDKSPAKCDKNGNSKLSVQNGNIFPSHSGALSVLNAAGETPLFPLKEESKAAFLPHCFYPQALKKLKGSDEILPYYGIKPTDYVNGSVVEQGVQDEQSQSDEGEGGKAQLTPNGFSHPGKELLPLLPNNRGSVVSVNGAHKPEVTPQQENLPQDSQPSDGRPSPAPAAENPSDSNENISPSPKSPSEETAPPAAKGVNGTTPAASGNKFCRVCNIQFSSLSNFITHKKFYCSSHAADQVK